MMAPTMPPWIRDPEPEKWVTVGVAARAYFRKSIVTVKQYIKTGYLEECGIPSYWDGTRWFVRLPYALGRNTQMQESSESKAASVK